MPNHNKIVLTTGDYEKAAHKLRDLVTTIEFTMISIIAGLMLFPWVDQATALLHEQRYQDSIYLAVVLVLILFFWTALTVHALTFVGWPIDILHNLIYLIVFPVVAITVQFVNDPVSFHSVFVAVPSISFILATYDLSLIRARLKEASGAEAELYAAVHARQFTLTRIVLVAVGMTAVNAVLVRTFPELFIGRGLHLVSAVLDLLLLVFMLAREIFELGRMKSKMLKRMAEEVARECVDASQLARLGSIQ